MCWSWCERLWWPCAWPKPIGVMQGGHECLRLSVFLKILKVMSISSSLLVGEGIGHSARWHVQAVASSSTTTTLPVGHSSYTSVSGPDFSRTSRISHPSHPLVRRCLTRASRTTRSSAVSLCTSMYGMEDQVCDRDMCTHMSRPQLLERLLTCDRVEAYSLNACFVLATLPCAVQSRGWERFAVHVAGMTRGVCPVSTSY